MSMASAPGTAVLLMYGGGICGTLRSAQVVGVAPPTRACVNTFVNGGGQPGLRMSGTKNGERIALASTTAYDCCCAVVDPARLESRRDRVAHRDVAGEQRIDRRIRERPVQLIVLAGRDEEQTEEGGRGSLSPNHESHSSEGVSQPDPEQMGGELVETGVARGQVHRAAPVMLFDVLVREVPMQLGSEYQPSANRELVARSLGQQRCDEL